MQHNKIMRLRGFDGVIRRHKFKQDKNGLLMFFPWRDELELLPNVPQECKELFIKVKQLLKFLNIVTLAAGQMNTFINNRNTVYKLTNRSLKREIKLSISQICHRADCHSPQTYGHNKMSNQPTASHSIASTAHLVLIPHRPVGLQRIDLEDTIHFYHNQR